MNLFFLLALAVFPNFHSITVSQASTGITVSVSSRGNYLITAQDPAWAFGGVLGGVLEDLHLNTGSDRIGPYDEIAFRYSTEALRYGSIRAYHSKPIVIFTATILTPGKNTPSFPTLSAYPRGLHRLTYNGGDYFFDKSRTDGPLIEFDDEAHAFILSAATHFLLTTTAIDHNDNMISGIDPSIAILPEHFSHQTILVIGKGINQTFDMWGKALTDLAGKRRPRNDADITLSHLGYWTDHGATYYYHFEPALGYENTLLAIRKEFRAKGVPLGYLQLDSWFYPKGPEARWDDLAHGIYKYVASPDLFSTGLKAFQQELGIPLVTHARWIDASSPYRREYRLSGNVVIDPRYWEATMRYLHDSGVATYEQDWLSAFAHTDLNLTDPDTFLDDMAQAAARYGLTMQYCMPRARDYLQTSRYNNLTTMRTSGDRFDRSHWDQFLYGSRLAGALGVWPWADVFMSSELDNLLLATLSGGVVGVGDAIGSVNAQNLSRAVRKDGVIVKPDAPLVPLDESFIHDAQQVHAPMVAWTYTDFGNLRISYLITYNRAASGMITLSPTDVGLTGRVYIYNYFEKTGQELEPGGTFTTRVSGTLDYYVLTPIGKSNIALIGDRDQLVPLGKQRVTHLTDDGTLHLLLTFAQGEASRVIEGYSQSKPVVTVKSGDASSPTYDSVTHRFRLTVSGDAHGSAAIDLVSAD
ncbi:MAG TPA: hypothetical protein VJN43_20280 [Bryobacteraceae bacterium]|nr:hypothetical protein [Bryobacteraceae bacterium]